MSTNQKNRPNILFIQTDQLRADILAAYGGTVCRTPHLDALVEESTVFDQAYTSCPVCTPARGSLQTGLYPFKHGMQTNSYGMGSMLQELPDTPRLLSHQLQNQQYSIGYTGKWHLGNGPTAQQFVKYVQFPEIIAGIRSLPTDVGYEGDDFPGHGGGGMHYSSYQQYLNEHDLEWKLDNIITGHFEGHYAAELVSPVEATVEYYLTERAIHYIDLFSKREKPFFFSLNFWGPHEPYIAPTAYLNWYRDLELAPWPNFDEEPSTSKPSIHSIKRSKHREWSDFEPYVKHYYGFMSSIDAQIGRLIEYLKQNNLYDDMLIIFTADHGESLGIHGGLRDKSFFMYDETCRIPLLVKPPEHIQHKSREERFVGTCDIHATILEAAGVSELQSGCDGRSFLSMLSSEDLADWPETIVTEGAGLEHVMFTQRMLRKGNYKYVFNAGDMDELYDLVHDPYELTNLIASPTHATILEEMHQALADWMYDHEDGLLKQYRRLRMNGD